MYGTLRKINSEQLYPISPINLPLLSALYKMPERNIHQVLIPLSQAVKTIELVSTADNIKLSPDILLQSGFLDPTIPYARLDSLYKVYDVVYIKNYYKSDPESKVLSFKNLKDDAALNHLNSKFFQNTPINFYAL